MNSHVPTLRVAALCRAAVPIYFPRTRAPAARRLVPARAGPSLFARSKTYQGHLEHFAPDLVYIPLRDIALAAASKTYESESEESEIKCPGYYATLKAIAMALGTFYRELTVVEAIPYPAPGHHR